MSDDVNALEWLLARPGDDGRAVDFSRLSGLIVHGVETHPEQDRVYEFIRQGASFTTRHRDGRVEVRLAFGDNAETVAAMRGDVWGYTPEEVDPANVGEVIDLISAPLSVLRTVPQG